MDLCDQMPPPPPPPPPAPSQAITQDQPSHFYQILAFVLLHFIFGPHHVFKRMQWGSPWIVGPGLHPDCPWMWNPVLLYTKKLIVATRY